MFGYQCLREVGWGARTGARRARGLSTYAGPESMTVLEDSSNGKKRGLRLKDVVSRKVCIRVFY